MKLKKTRLALYVVLVVLLLSSAIATTYAKYASQPVTDEFKVYVTAGTVTLDISGGDSGVIVTPGTYIAATQTKVQVGKKSEDCFVFVKVSKTDNIKDIMTVNVQSDWTQLDGHSDVYYMELTKEQIKAKAKADDSDVASYNFFAKKAEAIWVSPTATKAQVNAITSADKITFTAYAVQKTPGIMDATAAWEAVNK